MSKLIYENIDNWSNIVQSKLYPLTCFICEQQGHNGLDLCSHCLNDLKPITPSCSICNIQLTTKSSICGRCLKTPPSFDQIISLYQYEGIAQFLLQSLKFQARHSCARTMGKLMARHFTQLNKQPDLLLAVPLHAKRLRERGFNQSELIVQYIQKALDAPLNQHSLKRVVNTASQTTLKPPERRKNLKNAFHYTPVKDINSVAIIDDVVTTGSTANEIAKTLKKQGVQHVEVWSFARA
ncbi:MAG: ComF family protein [Cycloclasticus sp.]|nr:ComF family protein [Cycloclasticus sp.]